MVSVCLSVLLNRFECELSVLSKNSFSWLGRLSCKYSGMCSSILCCMLDCVSSYFLKDFWALKGLITSNLITWQGRHLFSVAVCVMFTYLKKNYLFSISLKCYFAGRTLISKGHIWFDIWLQITSMCWSLTLICSCPTSAVRQSPESCNNYKVHDSNSEDNLTFLLRLVSSSGSLDCR